MTNAIWVVIEQNTVATHTEKMRYDIACMIRHDLL